MSRTGAVRQYGKPTKRSRAERLFAELPQSPVRSPVRRTLRKSLGNGKDGVGEISELVAAVRIDDDDDELGAGDGEVEVSGRKPPARRTRKSDVWQEIEGSPLESGALEEDDELSLMEGQDEVEERVSERASRTRGTKKAGIKREEEDLPPPRTRRTRNAEIKRRVEDTPRQLETPVDNEPAVAAEHDRVDEGASERKARTNRTRKTETKRKAEAPSHQPGTPAIRGDSPSVDENGGVGERASERKSRTRGTRRTTVTQEVEDPSHQLQTPEDDYEPPLGDNHDVADPEAQAPEEGDEDAPADSDLQSGLRTLSWDDVCPFPDTITKIAEASYAEVYRVTNPRGTSIIKVIRLTSPIKAQTKAQVRSGLVDEEPHEESDLLGELRISEWLADIPGFVVYKDRYVVRGKAPKALVETHQAFQRKVKRADPDRLQFYPSPTRYLDDTRFLVVELGDAGTALEDFRLETVDQVWDIFLLVAIALARAEDLVFFEHRDLHEGNVCIRQVSEPKDPDPAHPDRRFGYSGLDITILDYGLSRADDPYADDVPPVAYDLERDLSIFTSTHAAQCAVYRQMRSFLLRGDRKCLPAKGHNAPYEAAFDGEPISWAAFAPYTNALWLAYTYRYLVDHFAGPKSEAARFNRETREMWRYLKPGAAAGVPCFGSAGDVVRFAVESGWVLEGQIMGENSTVMEREDSIMVEDEDGARVRRSARGRE